MLRLIQLIIPIAIVMMAPDIAEAQSSPDETPTEASTEVASTDTAAEPEPDGEEEAASAEPATAPPSAAEATTASETAADTAAGREESPELDAGTYAVRLRDLEQRINELKEQIFRSKARLSLLAETVLQGVVAGAQAIVVHENRM